MKQKTVFEVRDTGGKGMSLLELIDTCKLFYQKDIIKHEIRTGSVKVNNAITKDVLHFLPTGSYQIQIKGQLFLKATIL